MTTAAATEFEVIGLRWDTSRHAAADGKIWRAYAWSVGGDHAATFAEHTGTTESEALDGLRRQLCVQYKLSSTLGIRNDLGHVIHAG